MIRVLLVADEALFRSALAATLANEDDLDVVGEFDSARDLGRTPADVAIVDGDVPGRSGVVTPGPGGRIRVRSVLVLTTDHAPSARRFTGVGGVTGLVAKDRGMGELVDAVRRVAAGEPVFGLAPSSAAARTPDSPLTERETDVLRLAADGLPSARIADDLGLTVGTVRNYMSAIVRKTGSRNRLEAVRAASTAGWL